GGRPLEEASRGNGSQNVNLPPFLAAHIGRSENGQPLQSSPTSAYGGLFPNPLGSVTPFIRWIEDYPIPDGLKMPSHIGSYDGKGDPDNFLHLFEGAIRMQKWLVPVACHMFTYNLKYSARIWWNSQKAGQLSHLVKGIKKEKAKSTDTPRGEGKKDKSTPPVEAPILMISRENYASKDTVSESMAYKEGITFPPVTRVSNAPVIIEAMVFGKKVGEAGEETKKARRTLTISKESIPNYDDTEEKIVVNDKHPEQMVTIRKRLPEHFKKELRNLLRANADIFTWTHADMTGIPRTIMVDKKPFNTEHKLNKYSHIKLIK
ncbi:hypothetical protein Tco_0981876, partial [Tanacetum coccineum]